MSKADAVDAVASTISPEARAPARTLRVALIGNPNTGKSTLFNALSGLRVRTGNYPGVTVEERVGRLLWSGTSVELIDLPGTYSLSPRSPDELVTVEVLTGTGGQPRPDVVVCICDANALERNLFLVVQILELGLPTVVCLNMWDSLQRSGLSIDQAALSRELGTAVVATSASRREGLDELRSAICCAAATGVLRTSSALSTTILPLDDFAASIDELAKTCQHGTASVSARWLVSRCVLEPGGYLESVLVKSSGAEFRARLQSLQHELARRDIDVRGLEARCRYATISPLVARVQTRVAEPRRRLSDSIDSVLTHRVWGLLICLGVLLLIFATIYWFSQPLSGAVENSLGWLSDLVTSSMSPGPLRSLLTEGVFAGVGSVVVFVPQIALLFLFIAMLEDCGYMARAAFMMDRVMGLLGLSGRSFLPLMSSFACAVPGIMATRVIDDRRERLVTILIAPLMSCSARLPVYVLMIGTFIPDQMLLGWLPLRAVVLFVMSTLGLIIAVPVALLMRRVMYRGEPSPFLLEMPDYRMPSLRVVVMRVWDSAKSFVMRAGTMIFATSVLVWLAGSYPGEHGPQYDLQSQLEQMSEDDPKSEQLIARLNDVNSALLSGSVLGHVGHAVEPLFKPLGWDWKIGVGAIASFPAREVIIATLGTIYSLGADVDEADAGLRATLQAATWPDGRPVFTIPVALSIMVFFALCAQCVSTLMVIRRETNSWRWPAFSFVYMTVLAYAGALLTYQVGIRW